MSVVCPEIFLTVAAVVALLWDAGRPVSRRAFLIFSTVVLGATAAWVLRSENGAAYGVFLSDPMSRYAKLLLLAAVGGVTVLSANHAGFDRPGFAWGTYGGLLLLSTVGLFLLVSSQDLLLVLIALELISVTSFVMTGFLKDDRRASEAAIKYFLVGALSAGIMIYGLSLVYGVTGTTNISALVNPKPEWPVLPLVGSLVLVLVGFGFKLAWAPFQMWAPDVYEGAPTPVTAYLSVAPKAAAFVMLLRILPNHGALHLTSFLAAVAALTMTVGNLGALRQTNIKRLLAYSSVAQMGYVLMGFVAAGSAGPRSVLVYLTGYVFMNLGAFAVVSAVTDDAKSESLDAFNGLAGRSLPVALFTTIFMLSLTGLPPFVGFIGKFGLLSAVFQSSGLMWLAVVASINTVISFAYYFSVVRAMFFGTTDRTHAPAFSPALAGCLMVTLLATVLGGVAPNALLTVVRSLVP